MLSRKEEEEVEEEPGVDSTLVAFVAAKAVFVKHLVPFTNLGCLLESKGRSGASYTTTTEKRLRRGGGKGQANSLCEPRARHRRRRCQLRHSFLCLDKLRQLCDATAAAVASFNFQSNYTPLTLNKS